MNSLANGMVMRTRRLGSVVGFIDVAGWLKHARWTLQVVSTRKQLLAMDDHMLNDIGVSRTDALREAGRNVWDTAPHSDPTRRTNPAAAVRLGLALALLALPVSAQAQEAEPVGILGAQCHWTAARGCICQSDVVEDLFTESDLLLMMPPPDLYFPTQAMIDDIMRTQHDTCTSEAATAPTLASSR